MFNKTDYLEYFTQIQDLESKMLREVSDLLAVIVDEEMRSTLKKIFDDEVNHQSILKEILATINDNVE